MSNPIRFKHVAFTGCAVLLLLAGSISVIALHHHQATKTAHSIMTAKNSAKTSPASSASNSIATTKTSNPLQSNNTADADKQVTAASNGQPVTEACKLLTSAVARQLVGTSAVASTPSDTSSLRTTNTTTTACAYSGGSGAIQLTIRTPTTSTGASENDTMFGSARPSNAVAVTGYGQSAYWDPGSQTLNVLGSNNWYIITRKPSSQANAEAVAQLIQSGF